MADTKFKVGDRVQNVSDDASPRGTIATVVREPYGGRAGGTVEVRLRDGSSRIWLGDLMRLAAPDKAPFEASPKFILQFELETAPFEFFATEKKARKRIAELADRADLKRDSIRLIEIKKIRTVKLGTKITISK